MRFLIEYKDFKSKETNNRTLHLLDTFLNEHLIGKFHGHTFECILIRFIQNAPRTKKLKLNSLYKTIAEVEVNGGFKNPGKLDLEDFQHGLMKVEEAIKKVRYIERKEPMDFHEEELLADYRNAFSFVPKTKEELKDYAKIEQEIWVKNQAKRADCLMYSCSIHPRPLTRKIVGIRIYDKFEKGTLSPYDYIYSELFSNLLRKANVLLPNYDEIYIHIGETMDMAKQEIALETWHKYTYSTLDIAAYLAGDEQVRAEMLFYSVCDGLRLISEFDHLENEKIEKVIHTIKQKGLDMELTYDSKTNKDYLAEIVYKVPKSHLEKAKYNLKVTDLTTGKTSVNHIDFINTFYAPYSFGKIIIKKNQIVLKGRESFRAEISREADKLPDEYVFNIGELFQIT
ncbi:hypothetical protein WQ57_00410 [Mesobacillus campisalis]|uniref:Uncharacterized protein n=1 Tax=Mesobacillus campisalis TaxID=1408103 RepID=A0A0M2T1F5_9BACI|nr:hypothetical protein [Mesobacillus campisalis]KKK39796.1 hypothetical protein WQ57_00410 [Mesobacillus campisalis]